MTQYTTQMDAARQGIITPQMEIVAEKEHFDVEELRELIAKGRRGQCVYSCKYKPQVT